MFNGYQFPQNPMNNFYRNPMGNFPAGNPIAQQNQFVTRQVTNIEEAKAFIIDAFNTYLFIDMNAGKIYMKRMNNNGLSDFYTFGVEEQPQVEKSDPLSEINKRLTNIENKLGGVNNVQSVSNNAGNAESKPNDAKSNGGANEKSESTVVSKSSRND